VHVCARPPTTSHHNGAQNNWHHHPPTHPPTHHAQTLLDDPDLPGFQPALPRAFDLQAYARQVEAEQQARAARRRGLFGGGGFVGGE
jgi:hypothetical protein